jgi:hypothetical protein
MSFSQKSVLRLQGAYYVATGVWPLLSMRLFEAVTGRKTDRWLVQTVGLLVICIGTSIALETRRERTSPAILALAISSALSLAAIEIVHTARRRISPIYLLDAFLEVALAYGLIRDEWGSFPSD